MKLSDVLDRWSLSSLRLHVGILEAEWEPREEDREAAWELYVEMLTRSLTQPLPEGAGVEQAALDSVHSLFGITREILRRKGRSCIQFSKVAIVVLNQVVRPFTTRWHLRSVESGFAEPAIRAEFRKELGILQTSLRRYASALAEIAQVEDLGSLVAQGGEHDLSHSRSRGLAI